MQKEAAIKDTQRYANGIDLVIGGALLLVWIMFFISCLSESMVNHSKSSFLPFPAKEGEKKKKYKSKQQQQSKQLKKKSPTTSNDDRPHQ
jgi:hypothetical protein